MHHLAAHPLQWHLAIHLMVILRREATRAAPLQVIHPMEATMEVLRALLLLATHQRITLRLALIHLKVLIRLGLLVDRRQLPGTTEDLEDHHRQGGQMASHRRLCLRHQTIMTDRLAEVVILTEVAAILLTEHQLTHIVVMTVQIQGVHRLQITTVMTEMRVVSLHAITHRVMIAGTHHRGTHPLRTLLVRIHTAVDLHLVLQILMAVHMMLHRQPQILTTVDHLRQLAETHTVDHMREPRRLDLILMPALQCLHLIPMAKLPVTMAVIQGISHIESGACQQLVSLRGLPDR